MKVFPWQNAFMQVFYEFNLATYSTIIWIINHRHTWKIRWCWLLTYINKKMKVQLPQDLIWIQTKQNQPNKEGTKERKKSFHKDHIYALGKYQKKTSGHYALGTWENMSSKKWFKSPLSMSNSNNFSRASCIQFINKNKHV